MERITQEQLKTIHERGDKSALKGKDLCGLVFKGDWSCWDFSGANLRGVDLRGADLRRANLRWVDLRGANLCGTILIDANLRWATLNSADLRGAKLLDANLQEASLQEANLCGANLWRANLCGANLRDASLRDAGLWGADLRDAGLWNCIGNSNELRTVQFPKYNIVFWKDRIQIGCKNYSADEWRTFSDQKIADMDFGALAWWREYKEVVFLMYEIYQGK